MKVTHDVTMLKAVMKANTCAVCNIQDYVYSDMFRIQEP